MYLVLDMIECQDPGKEHHHGVVHPNVIRVVIGDPFEPANCVITQVSNSPSDERRDVRQSHRYVLSGEPAKNCQHRLRSNFLTRVGLYEYFAASAADDNVGLEAEKTVAGDPFSAPHGPHHERGLALPFALLLTPPGRGRGGHDPPTNPNTGPP